MYNTHRSVEFMRNKKGFTLMEMLIVVAIIAILIALAIPAFSDLLTKAKRTKDEGTLRTAYAEGMACMLTGEKTKHSGVYTAKVNLSAKYTKFRIFGELYFTDGAPAYMKTENVSYIDGVPYLNKSGINGKLYIIVRVFPDGTVSYEGLKLNHHEDSYYDKIYSSN